MTREKQLEIYKDLDETIMKITESKGHDYADEDTMSNFKNVSAAAKALNINIGTSSGYSLFMVILKIARLTNLIKDGKTPTNESIKDSFMDGINYFKLAYCCYYDEINPEDYIVKK